MQQLNRRHQTQARNEHPDMEDRQEETALNRMPDLVMPAMPPLGLITAIENWIKRRLDAWKHQRHLRRSRQESELLDQRMRDDIGIDQPSVDEQTPGASSPCRG
ncbi:hypothetical protein [Halomonas cupida]|uniref:hypothetical protein n=1 Tax=Halomonas cupida TaxID=44933 RepID=UPI003A93919B